MILTSYILGGLLAVVCIGSAGADFTRHPTVMQSLNRLGFKPGFERVCGAFKLAGGVGIVAGIWARTFGIFATECVAVYFLCAALAHLRVRDSAKDTAPAAVLLVLAIAATITHMAS